MMPPVKDAAKHWRIPTKKPVTSVTGSIIEESVCSEACRASAKHQAKDGTADWMRARWYTERININPSTHATPAARMGMLNENPAADTEAHSVHTETSSLPMAVLEAQLGQHVFMDEFLLLAI